ncbi:stage II sporulation protein M [Brevibacillus sp. SYP-B805]|uniref:stage II sporulation protein M n=1 Tax=Brevibacillus sp. SYP-B805 TaxID=1578199 RepID=UPI0013ED5954|nr:stage II sporulation protein M [Brevibacillus sp. SYP-B805]NGQ97225.1 stage II sporulation protein M [Brevibacillus sp. SYP-B805]
MVKHLALLWSVNRRYFYAAGLLLIAGVLIGYIEADLVDAMAKQMLAQIKGIVDRIKDSGGSIPVTFWAIFLNNVSSAVSMMLLGLLFAVFPIFGLLSNGILLGYLMQKISSAGMNALFFLLVGIMPHGIFELPAVVFAAALGIRYGILVMRSIGASWRADTREAVKREWLVSIKQFPLAVGTVVFVLLVAALVESAVTPYLIKSFIGTQSLKLQF